MFGISERFVGLLFEQKQYLVKLMFSIAVQVDRNRIVDIRIYC